MPMTRLFENNPSKSYSKVMPTRKPGRTSWVGFGILPPRPWSSPFTGGYVSKKLWIKILDLNTTLW
jgi:hypothetical protein